MEYHKTHGLFCHAFKNLSKILQLIERVFPECVYDLVALRRERS